MLFGRKPRLPVDFILKGQQEIEEEDQGILACGERMNEIYTLANQSMWILSRQDKERPQSNLKTTINQIFDPREESGKLKPFWEQKVLHNKRS